MDTIKMKLDDFKSLTNATQTHDCISGLIHVLWDREAEYITTCQDIQTGCGDKRPENEDPARSLENLRIVYALTAEEIAERVWPIRQISEILREVEQLLKTVEVTRRIQLNQATAATPQPAPVPSEAAAPQSDTVCVNSEALDNIKILTAMVKDLHAEQVHNEKLLARCRDLMRARGISEEEITEKSE